MQWNTSGAVDASAISRSASAMPPDAELVISR